jgi:long-chain acyl-CoA synthetase
MDEFGLRHFAARDRDAVAVIEQNDAIWSRGELLALADRTACAFAAAGLEPGDVVAIVAPNCAEFLAAYLGGIAAGLYVVPVNWHLAAPEIDYLLENSGAKAIVAHARLGEHRLATLRAHAACVRTLVAIGRADGFRELRELALAASRPLPNVPEGRMLPYTSATTGRPKGVWHPLSGAREAVRRFVEWHLALGVELEHDNVHLCSSMLYHAAPLEGARVALEMGHTVALMDAWEPLAFLDVIERRRVTTTFMTPTMFARLLRLPADARAGRSIQSLRFVVHGGAPCSPEVKRRMIDWWGPIIWESYGASEAQGTIASSEEWLRRPGTVGKPIAGTRLAILDERGRELPPGEIGLIYLTPYTGEPFEYYGDEAKTRACRRGDFVCVGDLGYVDDDGYLFLCGRKTELIISSGMNIYPAEIEQALSEHPAVADCAVVAEPHELFGEVPHALVQPAPDAVPGTELTRELLRFLSERVAAMKLPRRIEYRATLPRDPNGKLLRGALRREVEP